MASAKAISSAIRNMRLAYLQQRVDQEYEMMLYGVLAPMTDDELGAAVLRIVEECTRPPTPADIRRYCMLIRAENIDRDEHPHRDARDYWDRPEAERREIDEERNRAMAAIRKLTGEWSQ